ncbi:protein of unknown function [Pseudodesulfovibrio piezophilus C1TLV30]|uniref:Uncharacterized protein n=1 Tax=Pseudodesulfovibrio piezophilus (strain DSM 21447 / JCM 15486 / C1TLV30) TaxID=1322246 RepID=M1WL87_PSEP2|nr:protein of unknown function [Pseudodesulfovibrio piezophilus C1TLV30]
MNLLLENMAPSYICELCHESTIVNLYETMSFYLAKQAYIQLDNLRRPQTNSNQTETNR